MVDGGGGGVWRLKCIGYIGFWILDGLSTFGHGEDGGWLVGVVVLECEEYKGSFAVERDVEHSCEMNNLGSV